MVIIFRTDIPLDVSTADFVCRETQQRVRKFTLKMIHPLFSVYYPDNDMTYVTIASKQIESIIG